jgi:hypothetical protein
MEGVDHGDFWTVGFIPRVKRFARARAHANGGRNTTPPVVENQ